MKVSSVPSRWILDQGSRLDAAPYLSGAMDARMTLAKLSTPCDRLGDVTESIFHAGRESRSWVTDPNHGIPFLSSSDILKADLTDLPLLSRKQVARNPGFLIRKRWTLITRSGTIGRMVYVRPDMDGMACSEHAMRVVPQEDRIPSGYLHAFLRSRFGVPMVVGGTYGSIIQSIEPEHVADLPVPRLGAQVEGKAHGLIEKAALDRSEASQHRRKALELATQLIGWSPKPLYDLTNTVKASLLHRRMDAFHHSKSVHAARLALANHPQAAELGRVTDAVFEPNRGSRLKVEDPAFGVPFLSSSEVFRLDPVGEYLISRKTPHFDTLLVSENDLLLPRSGQIGGIIGRAVIPLPTYYGHAASEHLVRVRCKSQDDAFYLWAVLATEPGYYASVATAFGSSIPSLDCELLQGISIPYVKGKDRSTIVDRVQKAVDLQASAIRAEHEAIAAVEKSIEEAA